MVGRGVATVSGIVHDVTEVLVDELLKVCQFLCQLRRMNLRQKWWAWMNFGSFRAAGQH